MKTKKLVAAAAVAATLCVTIGGTLAWLTDTTEKTTNTFTVGNVDIDLTETTGNSYKMVPGNTITKDPKVTVKAGSEACYVFVKVEESADINLNDYITYAIDTTDTDGEGPDTAYWTALPGVEGVYYKEVVSSQNDQVFPVLEKNQVVVKNTVTSEMMETAEATVPTLAFTAYAIQSANMADANAAWTALNVQ